MSERLPDRETLRRLIDYDPATGHATWKTRTSADFVSGKHSAERRAITFNKTYAGRETFTAKLNGGISGLQATLPGVKTGAARVVWKLMYGDEPQEVVAINGDLTDLRADNLQPSTKLISGKNQTMFRTNTSGVRGVYWDSARNMWTAEIKVSGKKKYLGRYPTLDRAAKARTSAERLYGFRFD